MRNGAVLIGLLCAAALAYPRGQGEAAGEGREPPRAEPAPSVSAPEGPLVEITGRVRLVGNEPFPELVLTGEDGRDWFIAEEDRAVLSAYEQRTVTVRGRVSLREMILANGQRLESRRILSGLTLVR
ncbi:MAG: hypothetical protein LBU28_02495 [Spirochaetaceae bacterium]|nr:hypothetical protein [Spirochaetaceae bacterium]